MIFNTFIQRGARTKLLQTLRFNFTTMGGAERLYGYGDVLRPTYLPRPGAGKSKKIALIPGSGIGSMLIDSVEQIFEH